MTTPRDLLLVALDVAADRSVARGDLSLAMAGAEVIDLLAVRAVALDADRLVPGGDRHAAGDRLLAEALASLARQEPGPTVEDWLWLRGRGLASAYLAAFEAEGQLTPRRGRRLPFRDRRMVPADSPARDRAARRWAEREPVLTALAGAVGITDRADRADRADGDPGIADDGTELVLAAVNDAVMELEAVRQRRAVEEAAFDNIWRGGDGLL